MKTVLKFKFDGKEGFLSVVEKNNVYYALVQKETPKVKAIEDTSKLSVSYDLKNPLYKEVFVKVIYDVTMIKWVYHQLEADNNLYFKNLDDSLCVLEIPK